MKKLIFIDTNILLDFYRMPQGSVTAKLLEHIDKHHERIITSDQVQMEFKKNRQKVILDSLKQFKEPDWAATKVPAFLVEAQATKKLKDCKSGLKSSIAKLTKRINRVLEAPEIYDPVYKVLQRLFKNNSELNLNRAKKIRYKLRHLSRKRFNLGYPPRKDSDLSFGDAINWEWIIYCAEQHMADVVVVSRDTDYGINRDGKGIVNDWLDDEFKSRVSKKRKLILTGRLSEAFKLVSVAVEPQTAAEEKSAIQAIESKEKSEAPSKSLSELLKELWTMQKTIEGNAPQGA